jgi:ubiquinone/menaquinone biosynthesis C-methylase UbiE/DNA-binding MarR family transcriptional regulator
MLTPAEQLIQQLKSFADLTRMRLVALCRQGESGVSELTEVIGQSQPRISQHLRVLCDGGLLVRQRDGKRVFYRVPQGGDAAALREQLLALIPVDDRIFIDDWQRLLELRGQHLGPASRKTSFDDADRAIYRAIIDLTVTAPIGSLLDIGCGRGQILKLLASRATRAVGVDIDEKARELARAELMIAGVPGCSLRKGDMYRLPFDDHEFDTIILDDVLAKAKQPIRALIEARRLLKPGGRVLLLLSVDDRSTDQLKQSLAQWSAAARLRLAPARIASQKNPRWMLAVATVADSEAEAA